MLQHYIQLLYGPCGQSSITKDAACLGWTTLMWRHRAVLVLLFDVSVQQRQITQRHRADVGRRHEIRKIDRTHLRRRRFAIVIDTESINQAYRWRYWWYSNSNLSPSKYLLLLLLHKEEILSLYPSISPSDDGHIHNTRQWYHLQWYHCRVLSNHQESRLTSGGIMSTKRQVWGLIKMLYNWLLLIAIFISGPYAVWFYVFFNS